MSSADHKTTDRCAVPACAHMRKWHHVGTKDYEGYCVICDRRSDWFTYNTAHEFMEPEDGS